MSRWQQRKQGKVPADCGSDDGVSLSLVVLLLSPPLPGSKQIGVFFWHAYSALVQFCFIFTKFTRSHQEAAVLQVASVYLLNWTQVGLKAVEVLEEEK